MRSGAYGSWNNGKSTKGTSTCSSLNPDFHLQKYRSSQYLQISPLFMTRRAKIIRKRIRKMFHKDQEMRTWYLSGDKPWDDSLDKRNSEKLEKILNTLPF